mgnify:CR=1 FL=1
MELFSFCIFGGDSFKVLYHIQGTYITSAAIAHGAEMKLDGEGIIGKFNGVFWGIFATHQVIAMLICINSCKENIFSP